LRDVTRGDYCSGGVAVPPPLPVSPPVSAGAVGAGTSIWTSGLSLVPICAITQMRIASTITPMIHGQGLRLRSVTLIWSAMSMLRSWGGATLAKGAWRRSERRQVHSGSLDQDQGKAPPR